MPTSRFSQAPIGIAVRRRTRGAAAVEYWTPGGELAFGSWGDEGELVFEFWKAGEPEEPGLPEGVPPAGVPELPPENPPELPCEKLPEFPAEFPPELPPTFPPEFPPEKPPEFPPELPPEKPPELFPEFPAEKLEFPPEPAPSCYWTGTMPRRPDLDNRGWSSSSSCWCSSRGKSVSH